jgi:hypothetical protein
VCARRRSVVVCVERRSAATGTGKLLRSTPEEPAPPYSTAPLGRFEGGCRGGGSPRSALLGTSCAPSPSSKGVCRRDGGEKVKGSPPAWSLLLLLTHAAPPTLDPPVVEAGRPRVEKEAGGLEEAEAVAEAGDGGRDGSRGWGPGFTLLVVTGPVTGLTGLDRLRYRPVTNRWVQKNLNLNSKN